MPKRSMPKQKQHRRHSDFLGPRIALVAGVLLVVAWQAPQHNPRTRTKIAPLQDLENRRFLGSSIPIGQACNVSFPEFCGDGSPGCKLGKNVEVAGVCCHADDTCIVDEGEVCMLDEVCEAHLIPGTTGATCLPDWEVSPKAQGAIINILLLMYLFIALAVVCDDYFVASLEQLSEGLHLSEDVAGATFMAAGSSAPELFVSLADNVISNPPKSLGIGTIVGSAIFNVLVIIGVSVALAGQALKIDWRPLSRDLFFYLVSIAIMVGVVNDGEVDTVESILLLLGYCAYLAFMTRNARVMKWLDTRFSQNKVGRAAGAAIFDEGAPAAKKDSIDDNLVAATAHAPPRAIEIKTTPKQPSSSWNSSSRVDGLDNLALDDIEDPSSTMAASTTATATAAATEIDAGLSTPRSTGNPMLEHRNRNGWVRPHHDGPPLPLSEVVRLVMSANRVARVFQDVTPQPSQTSRRIVEQNESSSSEPSTHIDIAETADAANNKGNSNILGVVVGQGENDEKKVTDEQDDGSSGGYWSSLSWPLHVPTKKQEEAQMKKLGIVGATRLVLCGGGLSLWRTRMWYLLTLPINLAFRLTIPDCNYDIFNEDGRRHFRKISVTLCFIMSIVWIAILSHLLTYFATRFGCVVGISPPLMGLTILAAGTSVPDAISSIIVARNGQGDMAVANSIGSNVFDILLGLGFPWFLANVIYGKPSAVVTDDLTVGIGFLVGVVVILVMVLVYNKWMMGPKQGFVLIGLYVLYVIFEFFVHCRLDDSCDD